ncbi:MAG: hypothetical protein IAF38_01090 [Bacteroidia bacterium]|nr:hypothetical protein [Bacteroidia bacterium]
MKNCAVIFFIAGILLFSCSSSNQNSSENKGTLPPFPEVDKYMFVYVYQDMNFLKYSEEGNKRDLLKLFKRAIDENNAPIDSIDHDFYYDELEVEDTVVWNEKEEEWKPVFKKVSPLEQKLKRTAFFDLDKNGETDIVHSCDYYVADGNATTVFMQKNGKFKKFDLYGNVSNFIFDSLKRVKTIYTYLPGPAMGDQSYGYKYEMHNDSIFEVLEYHFPKRFRFSSIDSSLLYFNLSERWVYKGIDSSKTKKEGDPMLYDPEGFFPRINDTIMVLASHDSLIFHGRQFFNEKENKTGMEFYYLNLKKYPSKFEVLK